MFKDNSTAVLRQPIMGTGTRRLPGPSVPVPPVKNDVVAAPDQNAIRNQLREQFADELMQLQKEASQRGLATAREQWQAEEKKLKQAFLDQQSQFKSVVESLQKAQAELLQSMEPMIGRLALLATLKLLGQHQQLRPLVPDMVAQTLDTYRLEGPLRIHLSAVDYEQVKSSGLHESLLAHLVSDANLVSGNCVIDHGTGRLEAGLEVQWDALKKALLSSQGVTHVASN